MDVLDSGNCADSLGPCDAGLSGNDSVEHKEDCEASCPNGREERCSTPDPEADTDDCESVREPEPDVLAPPILVATGAKFHLFHDATCRLPTVFMMRFPGVEREVRYHLMVEIEQEVNDELIDCSVIARCDLICPQEK